LTVRFFLTAFHICHEFLAPIWQEADTRPVGNLDAPADRKILDSARN